MVSNTPPSHHHHFQRRLCQKMYLATDSTIAPPTKKTATFLYLTNVSWPLDDTRKDATKKKISCFLVCLRRKNYRTMTSGWQGKNHPYFRRYAVSNSCGFKTGDPSKKVGGASVRVFFLCCCDCGATLVLLLLSARVLTKETHTGAKSGVYT